MKKKLLLHVCCGPCSLYVYKKLAEQENYDVTCFFYNPNIHGMAEYLFRKKELERIAEMFHWQVVYGEYDMKEWFQRVKGHEKDPERGERCTICFNMRLARTFLYARQFHFDAITTTLSISPYKVTRQINAVGEQLSQHFGIPYLAEDFKKHEGYTIGKKMAQSLGVKQQDYCGCSFSKVEKKLREQRNKKKFSI